MPNNKKGNGKPIPKIEINLNINDQQAEDLMVVLSKRFAQNMFRHPDLEWETIQAKLEQQPHKQASLHAMENTGGQPDVIGYDQTSDVYLFVDCAEQSPEGRRKICYDGEAQKEREKKGVFPAGNAVEIAAAMGVELLDESHYRTLQKLGEFDTRTQSWIKTPEDVRALGGAIFGDRRYGRVFVFHNSAPSFYSSRGFRGLLKV